jgi:hypothetical protein
MQLSVLSACRLSRSLAWDELDSGPMEEDAAADGLDLGTGLPTMAGALIHLSLQPEISITEGRLRTVGSNQILLCIHANGSPVLHI